MHRTIYTPRSFARTGSAGFLVLLALATGIFSEARGQQSPSGESGWDRTRRIMDCAPRLVDRRDLVEDRFDHFYVTTNPRDIEVGYFSVEPITYAEQGKRFCEALLPASGLSESHFRGTYETTYELPGDGVYEVTVFSSALIFNNPVRIIDAQNTLGTIEVTHRLQIFPDTSLNPGPPGEIPDVVNHRAYTWELEIDPSGGWKGRITPGEFEFMDSEVPAGFSRVRGKRQFRGPGKVTIRESVVFHIESVSGYRYDPIFQAACLFSLEPLGISTRLLPCAGD